MQTYEGTVYYGVTAADFDGDKKVDLIATVCDPYLSSKGFDFYQGDGTGNFYFQRRIEDLKPTDYLVSFWSSIDNPDSMDLDQLEYCELRGNGEILVRVAVADVDLYVKKDSPTDRHAARNGTSVYAGVETFPLFPDRLSKGITSLLPGEELVQQGLADLSRDQVSDCSLLVLIAAARLRRLGLEIPERPALRPYEHQLFARLEQRLGAGAHSYYNSLIRRIVSYARALERAGADYRHGELTRWRRFPLFSKAHPYPHFWLLSRICGYPEDSERRTADMGGAIVVRGGTPLMITALADFNGRRGLVLTASSRLSRESGGFPMHETLDSLRQSLVSCGRFQ
jgi:hypothetical protein